MLYKKRIEFRCSVCSTCMNVEDQHIHNNNENNTLITKNSSSNRTANDAVFKRSFYKIGRLCNQNFDTSLPHTDRLGDGIHSRVLCVDINRRAIHTHLITHIFQAFSFLLFPTSWRSGATNAIVAPTTKHLSSHYVCIPMNKRALTLGNTHTQPCTHTCAQSQEL